MKGYFRRSLAEVPEDFGRKYLKLKVCLVKFLYQLLIYRVEYFRNAGRKGGWFDSSSKWWEVQTEVDVS